MSKNLADLRLPDVSPIRVPEQSPGFTQPLPERRGVYNTLLVCPRDDSPFAQQAIRVADQLRHRLKEPSRALLSPPQA